jgi:hypothetical protein
VADISQDNDPCFNLRLGLEIIEPVEDAVGLLHSIRPHRARKG